MSLRGVKRLRTLNQVQGEANPEIPHFARNMLRNLLIASLRPEHHAVQGFARNDFLWKL
jgi:hypothetical protein